MSVTVSLVIVGGGRMGRAILEECRSGTDFRAAGVILRQAPESSLPGDPAVFLDLDAGLAAASGAVLVDFSGPAGAGDRVRRAAERGHAVVLGTTGLGTEVEEALEIAAERVAVVVAPNTSPGVSLVRRALRAALPPPTLGWDVGVVERHHRAKQDAPSGTARLLERDLREAGRNRVEIVSLRQGGVIGEHAVHLAGDDEEIVLVHRAFSRRVFARGALLAARFAAAARPGRYGMDDVLG